jgi:hypothetical protein
MKLKLTPRLVHLVVFALAAAGLIVQYATGALQHGDPLTITAAWAATGSAIWALFLHNILQPDDSTRNPGLMKTKTVPPPPLSDSGEDTVVKRTAADDAFEACVTYSFALLLIGCIVSCAAVKPIINGIINLADAECALDANQPSESLTEIFVCEVIDPAGKIIQLFTVKVAADEVSTFAEKHTLKKGHPNPLTAVKQ